MSIFADVDAVLEEADFLASRLRRRTYIVDAGNMCFTVVHSYGREDKVLEIVNPPIELEAIEV